MQVCGADLVILHTVIAMGALSFRPGKIHDSQTFEERRAFAFKEYSKAISPHRQSTDEGKAQLRTNLLTCLEFVNFEVMAGFLDSATTLAYSGVRLIKKFFKGPFPEHATSISSPAPYTVEDALI